MLNFEIPSFTGYGPDEPVPTDDLARWLEQVETCFLLARTLADTLAWLRDAKGPNSEQLRAFVRLTHRKTLLEIRALGQTAMILWGVNVPLPKGLKEESDLG